MPINETLKGSLVRSNYLSGNESNYRRRESVKDNDSIILANGRFTNNLRPEQMSFSSSYSRSFNNVVINYENMFEVDTNNYQQSRNRLEARQGDSISMYSQQSYSRTPRTARLRGGTNRTQREADKLILSPSQCKIKALGMAYHDPRPQVNVISLKLPGTKTKTINTNSDCLYARQTTTKTSPPPQSLPKTKTRTRGTQSLYRESSAQTLPYLPPVSNNPDELEAMELFKLPTILPGDGPPGLYEVEVLERARKRWAFAKALKDNFRRQIEEAREQAKLAQHQHILEAFEWEHWIEREEYIQECQMLRLELLIRMFDQREGQMRSASQLRIQHSCQQIEAKRTAALKKSELEYGRAMRRLEIEHTKRPRMWRKEHISQGLGDPCSEFYAPKMRYGVDPSRRHFTASRRGFDMRMDDLEKKTVKMDPGHLKCPFAKLKEWSKPKEVVQEVEQNFCSEVNLRKLYESLRTLRETTEKQKTQPQCLLAKETPPSMVYDHGATARSTKVSITSDVAAFEYPREDSSSDDSELRQLHEEQEHQAYLQEVRKEKQAERHTREHLQQEMRHEEFETLIHAYEGNTIGWLMRFLTEEMCRLKEQRKLHFFTMLAKRERWRREAAEAGLRQKENSTRKSYEHMYQQCEQANVEVAEKFMRSILQTDIHDYADQEAQDHIVAVAKDLDKEIDGWLQSLREVQNPQNYCNLRYAIKDIIMPDVEKVLYRLERDDCIDYIINGVLLPNVYRSLESYDVSFSIASDFVDRLIDNDMHLNSPDCSSDCECTEYCTCSRARAEAMAILRRLIRRAVPGRRWRTSTERIADENVGDILDDVFDKVIPKGPIVETDKPMPDVVKKFSYLDLIEPEEEMFYSDVSEAESRPSKDYYRVNQMGDLPTMYSKDITKSLQNCEQLLLADPDKLSMDKLLIHCNEYNCPEPQPQPPIVHNIPSTHDISSVWDFNKTPVYCRTSSDDMPQEEMEATDAVDEIRERMESWALEMSSSHRGEEEQEEEVIEEACEEEQCEEEPIKVVNVEQRKMDSQVHFDAKPIVEEVIEMEPEAKSDDEEAGGVIPMAFSYDPTVKFTVPVPSSYEIVQGNESIEGTLEYKGNEGEQNTAKEG